ncbi:MAG: 23S rRNA (pseudouridine(1915)-N(3))-methyltransferase RlmH [Clostridia bacterium]|nr:23S rRNA (pseudouridine(1915)-N(3))-methyltransferase RlmH [Clostridia bacterium]
MINVNIICVGKLKEDYLRAACAEYQKRLGAFCRLNIFELTPARLPENPNESQIASALSDEADRILAKISNSDAVFAMCIEGKMLSSEALSAEIDKLGVSGFGTVSFIIGGSHGLDQKVKSRAKYRLSMSPMTFPHQLARVMLLEQIYRSFMISSGGKYHK